jgi:hypothetical protein
VLPNKEAVLEVRKLDVTKDLIFIEDFWNQRSTLSRLLGIRLFTVKIFQSMRSIDHPGNSNKYAV